MERREELLELLALRFRTLAGVRVTFASRHETQASHIRLVLTTSPTPFMSPFMLVLMLASSMFVPKTRSAVESRGPVTKLHSYISDSV